MPDSESIIMSPIFWTRCTELFFSLICFGLTVEYPETEALMFDHQLIWTRNTTYPEIIGLVNITEGGFVRLHFLTTATVAYTWIILPTMIICYFINGRQYMDRSVMCMILDGFGFLMFMVAGSLVCANFNGSYISGGKSAGVMCIINSLIFLIEVLGFIVYYYMYIELWDSSHYCLASIEGDNLTQIATVAYPFVIVPALLFSLILKENEMRKEIVPALLSCGGLLTCLSGGILIILECHNYYEGPIITGILVIVYSFTYLVDIIWFSYTRMALQKIILYLLIKIK